MMKPHHILLCAAFFAPAALLADTMQANAALQHGRVYEAEKSLRAVLKSSPNESRAHQLLCRVYYAQDQADQAVPECEAAVATAPNDSENQLWLGRAYGQKASHANPIAAYSLAKKVRAAFERAVETGPSNIAAMSDLGEFYVAAPSIVGGGLDKARRLAATLQTYSPAKAHRLLAYIADHAKDMRAAESEFKNAVTAGSTADAFVDLGLFYQTHGQTDRAVEAIRAAIQADHAHGPVLVDAASVLIDAKRAPDLAEQALRDYLSSSAQTDSAPVFKVHLQLGKLLAQRGDLAGAKREYANSVALAPNFSQAREAMKGA